MLWVFDAVMQGKDAAQGQSAELDRFGKLLAVFRKSAVQYGVADRLSLKPVKKVWTQNICALFQESSGLFPAGASLPNPCRKIVFIVMALGSFR